MSKQLENFDDRDRLNESGRVEGDVAHVFQAEVNAVREVAQAERAAVAAALAMPEMAPAVAAMREQVAILNKQDPALLAEFTAAMAGVVHPVLLETVTKIES